jgi:hypothetical protein
MLHDMEGPEPIFRENLATFLRSPTAITEIATAVGATLEARYTQLSERTAALEATTTTNGETGFPSVFGGGTGGGALYTT